MVIPKYCRTECDAMRGIAIETKTKGATYVKSLLQTPIYVAIFPNIYSEVYTHNLSFIVLRSYFYFELWPWNSKVF